jgi:hypothetical protein
MQQIFSVKPKPYERKSTAAFEDGSLNLPRSGSEMLKCVSSHLWYSPDNLMRVDG